MRYLLLLAALTTAFGLQSCKENNKELPQNEQTETTAEKTRYEAAPASVEFNDPKIADIYKAYIDLKTQLVNSDMATTAKAAEELLTAMSNYGVEEETFLAGQYIVESQSLEGQREGFERITAALEPMLLENIKGGTVYKQYCPMAFNNKGAYWLSNSQEIYNPYFGDVMLRCGRVSDSLQISAN